MFHLNQPFADFNYVVAFPQTAPVPPNKDTGTKYQLHPLSTGPYKFQSYQLNKQYTLVPNPEWNPSWTPQVKQLASKIIVNLNANANDIDNRLLAGDIQMDQAGSGVQGRGPGAKFFLTIAEGAVRRSAQRGHVVRRASTPRCRR